MICANCKDPINNRAIVIGGGLVVCGMNCKIAIVDNAAKGDTRSPRKKTAGPKIREGDVSKSIGADLKAAGIWNTRLQSGAIQVVNRLGQTHTMNLCTAGTPDRMFAAGVIVFVEVKGTGGVLSPKQSEVIEILRNNGALAFVVNDPLQFRNLQKALRKYENEIEGIRGQVRRLQTKIEAEMPDR